jgi:tetratricopeptide (TPR) repeat protein
MKQLCLILPLAVITCAAGSSDKTSVDPDAPIPPSPEPPAEVAPDATATAVSPGPSLAEIERESLLRIGEAKLTSGDFESALVAFRQVAQADPPVESAIAALLGMARTYTQQGELIKAVASYEYLLKTFEVGAHTPTANLEAGRILRDLGSDKQALARFYSVIHTTLRLTETDQGGYREVVRTAQFEIAETHLRAGDYESAARFFKRFELLDVQPEDRAWAQFKAARAMELSGQSREAITAYRSFIERNPGNEHTPEAHFLLASLLEADDQHRESLEVTLALLQHEQARSHEDQSRWRHWQKRTGNQLAAAFFARGEFNSALVLYRALALLSEDPSWRLPLVYHQGICYERLLDYPLALAAYSVILDHVEQASGFSDLGRMAEWRRDQISWRRDTHQNIRELLSPPPS